MEHRGKDVPSFIIFPFCRERGMKKMSSTFRDVILILSIINLFEIESLFESSLRFSSFENDLRTKNGISFLVRF